MRLFVTEAEIEALVTRAIERAQPPSAPEAFIAHLEAEVAFWRMQFMHERQRAERSIDQRLHEQGKGPVTFPLQPMTAEPRPQDLLEELMKNAEFAAMGTSEGVPT